MWWRGRLKHQTKGNVFCLGDFGGSLDVHVTGRKPPEFAQFPYNYGVHPNLLDSCESNDTRLLLCRYTLLLV